ncbi:hypothetical protein [Dermatobacter hominis]|uniref:hypothetical protein n=1 Tax=Dermatobacter hominis TaxID=2884263 RepID=UPI001D11F750|nr:hypothetical protein [Dermatobacter hominis]UDY34028.1 hypothetical protein LH044_11800 [Dermatobacter hominis]
MGSIHPRHLDQRRNLDPCDYEADADSYRLTEGLQFHIPAGGDEISMRIAEVQHRLVCRWNRSNRRRIAAQLGRQFGIKKQTISLTAKGLRWAGEPVLAALIHATEP